MNITHERQSLDNTLLFQYNACLVCFIHYFGTTMNQYLLKVLSNCPNGAFHIGYTTLFHDPANFDGQPCRNGLIFLVLVFYIMQEKLSPSPKTLVCTKKYISKLAVEVSCIFMLVFYMIITLQFVDWIIAARIKWSILLIDYHFYGRYQ